jgi:molybdopterin-guanine dinucleotide biosynthesis protein A
VRSEQATLILLTGGESRRMGFPKHRLRTSHGTLVELLQRRLSSLFAETLVVGRKLRVEDKKGLRTVEDVLSLRGPLVGIYSGLLAAKSDLCFVLACDMPFVTVQLVSYLLSQASGVDVVVPVVGSYYEPLCAVYRASSIPVIHEMLDRGDLKVASIYDRLAVKRVSEEDLGPLDADFPPFTNLNTPKELPLLSLFQSCRGRGFIATEALAAKGNAKFPKTKRCLSHREGIGISSPET